MRFRPSRPWRRSRPSRRCCTRQTSRAHLAALALPDPPIAILSLFTSTLLTVRLPEPAMPRVEAVARHPVDADVARPGDLRASKRRHRNVQGDLAALAPAEAHLLLASDDERAVLDHDLEVVDRLLVAARMNARRLRRCARSHRTVPTARSDRTLRPDSCGRRRVRRSRFEPRCSRPPPMPPRSFQARSPSSSIASLAVLSN